MRSARPTGSGLTRGCSGRGCGGWWGGFRALRRRVPQFGPLAGRTRKWRSFAAALVAALAYAGSSLAATYSPHGSSRGVRLAEAVMSAFATPPGYTYTETQF